MLRRAIVVAVSIAVSAAVLTLVATPAAAKPAPVARAAVAPGAIKHIVVINLENEDFGDTFGPSSPAAYLNGTLLAQGELIQNYYATSHASLGNYISQISGQASTAAANDDCINLATFPQLLGGFFDVAPGTDADASQWPGQVLGDGCVYPGADREFARRADHRRPARRTARRQRRPAHQLASVCRGHGQHPLARLRRRRSDGRHRLRAPAPRRRRRVEPGRRRVISTRPATLVSSTCTR